MPSSLIPEQTSAWMLKRSRYSHIFYSVKSSLKGMRFVKAEPCAHQCWNSEIFEGARTSSSITKRPLNSALLIVEEFFRRGTKYVPCK